MAIRLDLTPTRDVWLARELLRTGVSVWLPSGAPRPAADPMGDVEARDRYSSSPG